MKKQQSGFTLVEIAIVLVIIGLLLGGVLKGQELINSAKIKNIVNDYSGVTAAVYGYRDRYKVFPGDDSGAAVRWAGAGILSGNGDNTINAVTGGGTCVFSAGYATANECSLIWDHLRQSGFITGAIGTNAPQNAFGGTLGIQDGGDALLSGAAGTGFKGPIICESNIPDKAAIGLDNQLDDGNSLTGSIRAIVQTTPTTPPATVSGIAAAAAYVENGTTFYTVCKAL